MNERWLILQPHPDDMELGMGGYVHKATNSDNPPYIKVVNFFNGAYTRNDGVKVTRTERKEEMRRANGILGVHAAGHEKYSDNTGLDISRDALIGRVSHHIRQKEPTHVFVCLPSFNQDHVALYEATVTALRPSDTPMPALFAYEYMGNAWGPQPPNTGKRYIGLTHKNINAKLNALDCYKSQFEGRDDDFPYGPVKACQLASVRGAECGWPYAELLYLIRDVQ